MATPNRKCLACGKEYYFCFKCGRDMGPAWRIDFCDETCKNVFETISSYNCGSLTKEQANEQIGEIDSVKFETFRDEIKDKLKEIQPNTKVSKKDKGSFIDKKKEEPETKEDTSIGLMAPTPDEKDEK